MVRSDDCPTVGLSENDKNLRDTLGYVAAGLGHPRCGLWGSRDDIFVANNEHASDAIPNTFQLAITYEVDPRSYVVLRHDFTAFEWISNIGGLGFLFSIGSIISHAVDSPSMFITASMLAKGKVHTIKPNKSQKLNADFMEGTDEAIKKSTTDFMKYDETEVKEGCCTDLRTSLATSKCLTQRCKKLLGGTKAAILNKQ